MRKTALQYTTKWAPIFLLRHEGYIDSWLGLLKADNRAIFRASGQARCASEYVLNLEQQRK